MTRRNDKRNNRRNCQHNNNTELPPFAQMLFGAILAKGAEMIADTLMKDAEEKTEETPDIHAEGISNQDVTNINNGKASFTKCTIPTDGTAVELSIPDNLQVFISEDGKPMIRKKIEGDEEKIHDVGNGMREAIREPVTYDDICKELFFDKKTYWLGNRRINYFYPDGDGINDINNSTSEAQVKRLAAFNKLQNIAKYLNGDWKPEFDDINLNWSIVKDKSGYGAQYNMLINEGSVYFKSADLTDEAIRLMGKESLDDLFSTDW